jgi:DNA-binding LacI/PurR family transcriptional regulator
MSTRRPKPVTIHDVARQAGVSISTVSRAFGNPGRVNAVTREHVVRVAREVGYRPNPIARALESGQSNTIALLVPDITNPHFFGLIRGAEKQAAAAGVTMILGDTEGGSTEESLIDRLLPTVDGFILVASMLATARVRELSAGKPITLVNREVEGTSSVIVDHVQGTRQIIDHLVSLGHRTVAFLAGPRQSWSAARRWQALETAARALGVRATKLGHFTPSVEAGAAAADASVNAGVTAVVAHNDLLAIGMLRRLSARGITVPQQLSVVGYDDIFGADFCNPPLTTLAGPIQEVGRAAASILLRHSNTPAAGAEPATRMILPSYLVIRESTALAAGAIAPTRR